MHPPRPMRSALDRARWVVDADGLNILAEWPEGLSLLPPDAVLTPHPGEMARLTGLTTAEVNADRVGTATRWAADWGHTVALKGALTVVAAPDGRTAIVPFANPTLATAGSGDVMSGAVVGFLAQGMAPFEAAAAGAFAHGLAGEIAGARHGRRGATAMDIARCLSEAVERIEGRAVSRTWTWCDPTTATRPKAVAPDPSSLSRSVVLASSSARATSAARRPSSTAKRIRSCVASFR